MVEINDYLLPHYGLFENICTKTNNNNYFVMGFQDKKFTLNTFYYGK